MLLGWREEADVRFAAANSSAVECSGTSVVDPGAFFLIMCPFLSKMHEDKQRDEKSMERGICRTREEA